MMQTEERAILAVEDSDEDFYSLRQALKGAGIANPVRRCADSAAAFAALAMEDGCAEARRAAIILLDLNMPGVDGRELLQAFRQRDRTVPVIILSTSSHPDDIVASYEAGANSYLVKPLEFGSFQDMIATTCQYWLKTVALPPVLSRIAYRGR